MAHLLQVGRNILAEATGDDDGGSHGSHPFTFEELLSLCGTIWLIWFFGKVCTPPLPLPAEACGCGR